MNKSKSYPEIHQHFPINEIRKSKSLNDINENRFYFESFFEGDGPLGIRFQDKDGEILVSDIVDYTVASETFGLEVGFILTNINNKDISTLSFQKAMKKIGESWKTRSSVFLQFKKKVNDEIYNSLDSINYLDYYEHFIELGTKEKMDFDFIEYNDLVEMGVPSEKIKDFTRLNSSILSGR